MNTLAFLLGVVLCVAVVNGRSFQDTREPNPISEDEDEGLKKTHGTEIRHRRRRWQMNYGYDYPPPIPPYYPERREYDRNQQDYYPKIVKLLEEIAQYVKRPPPPPIPQPIYIPYPVPYPVPQYVGCAPTEPKQPNITNRWPEMEDTNQNWGFSLEEDPNETGDFSRPISFDPIKPKRPMKRPPPSVEHGSVQSDAQHSTQAPVFAEQESAASQSVGRTPVMCNAAILSCCAGKKQDEKQCFINFACEAYDSDNACTEKSINQALEAFKSAYSPIQ